MFDQSPFECRIEWGQRGARESAERGDITIIVDVLSFSSTVTTALHHGAIIYPYPQIPNGQERDYAKEVGAELVVGRAEGIKLGKPSLSPITFTKEHANKKYVLCSLNGAVCSWVASKVPALLIGSLLNSSAVANVANKLRIKTGTNITVIPCGEKWANSLEHENALRPGIEDYLGAGSILSKLIGSKSPEAQVCINAFENSKHGLDQLIWDCGSGRELRERGYSDDVSYSSQYDIYQTVPFLQDNRFVNAMEVLRT